MKISLRRGLIAAAVVVGAALSAFFMIGRGPDQAQYTTAVVDRGDVAEVVGTTGVLQAVTTVQVGSQVSGTVASLEADFNSRVTKGQVLARLDPSLLEARSQQVRANLTSALANVEKLRADLLDANQKLQRARALSAEGLLPRADLETAQANAAGANAQLKASQAGVTQARAAVNQADVDMTHTVIRAPIDGVVIARNVDVGQTVAASLQAPVLFVIANDLSRMQVNASVDEADIGRVAVGQDVSFRVDAFPEQTFSGRVEQVRLQPTTVSNVVTYNTLIAVENPGQRLLPGMTATVSLIVRARRDVLRVPAAATRFRPDAETAGGGRAARSGLAGAGAGPATAAAGPADERRPGGGEGNRARGGGGRRSRESDVSQPGDATEGRPGRLFAPGPDGTPTPLRVRLGISDGQYVEVVEGVQEGQAVITGIASAPGVTPARGGRPGASPAATNPFNPQPQRRRR